MQLGDAQLKTIEEAVRRIGDGEAGVEEEARRVGEKWFWGEERLGKWKLGGWVC